MEKKEIAEGFLGLLKTIQIKYLPDVVEFKISRKGNNAELCYKEYFTYLPKEIRDLVIPITMKVVGLLFKSIGMDASLNLIEQGIEMNLKGSPDAVIAMPLVEILAFGLPNTEQAKYLTDAMLKGIEATYSGKVISNWNEDAKKEVEQAINTLRTLMKNLGIETIEELMSMLDEREFISILKQFKGV